MNYLVQVQDEQSSWNVVDVTDSLGDAENKVSEMKSVMNRPVRVVGGRRAADQINQSK